MQKEFTYSEDVAKILLFLIENYESEEPINIGNTQEISIREVVSVVSEIAGYKGEIEWDASKPAGQFRKPSCNKKFIQLNPGFCYTDFSTGLRKTYSWFNKTYPKVRGVE